MSRIRSPLELTSLAKSSVDYTSGSPCLQIMTGYSILWCSFNSYSAFVVLSARNLHDPLGPWRIIVCAGGDTVRHDKLSIGRTFVATDLAGIDGAVVAAAARVGNALQGAVREGAAQLLLLRFGRATAGELQASIV